MANTFGATFLGVIASFLLWYGGTWWLKHQSDKKAKAHILAEIKEEITVNMELLNVSNTSIQKMLLQGNIPVALPARLRISVYNYATNSGELRLLSKEIRKNLSYVAYLTESTNKFIENTEVLLALWQLKPQDQALRLAHLRLQNLCDEMNDKRNALKRILDTL